MIKFALTAMCAVSALCASAISQAYLSPLSSPLPEEATVTASKAVATRGDAEPAAAEKPTLPPVLTQLYYNISSEDDVINLGCSLEIKESTDGSVIALNGLADWWALPDVGWPSIKGSWVTDSPTLLPNGGWGVSVKGGQICRSTNTDGSYSDFVLYWLDQTNDVLLNLTLAFPVADDGRLRPIEFEQLRVSTASGVQELYGCYIIPVIVRIDYSAAGEVTASYYVTRPYDWDTFTPNARLEFDLYRNDTGRWTKDPDSPYSLPMYVEQSETYVILPFTTYMKSGINVRMQIDAYRGRAYFANQLSYSLNGLEYLVSAFSQTGGSLGSLLDVLEMNDERTRFSWGGWGNICESGGDQMYFFGTSTYGRLLTGDAAGIEGVTVDDTAADGPAEYFNLQGLRVERPEGGIFIRRQGSKAVKAAL